jgi:hypothetical protein
VARAIKEKLTCSIEKCKQFSGFLKTVRQTIAVGVVISPLEQAQKKRDDDDDDQICVIDAMAEMERSETPREIGIHIREKQKEKRKQQETRECCRWPHKTHRTPRAPPPHAHRKMQTKTLAARGAPGLVWDIPWHSGRAFGTWDILLTLGILFQF